jgi:hypothetical protein
MLRVIESMSVCIVTNGMWQGAALKKRRMDGSQGNQEKSRGGRPRHDRHPEQFAAVVLRSIQALTPEQKAAARAEILRKFREHEDARLLAMPCSEYVN